MKNNSLFRRKCRTTLARNDSNEALKSIEMFLQKSCVETDD